MSDAEFDELIASLTREAKLHPRIFLWRTGGLAVLGFGFIFSVFLLAIALTLGLPFLLILIPSALTLYPAVILGISAGGLVWAILKALWIRFPVPDGTVLQRDNAPALMNLMDSLRQNLKSAPFHRVLLTGDYNASVCQIPLLGVLGWHRNYLILGLPLMLSLSAREFESVMAHEFAHLSRGHGRFSNWLYRMRRSWEQLFHQLARQKHNGGVVFQRFLRWFWPRFNAHAFVLSRANEYEADAGAARWAGPESTAAALTRVAVYTRHLDESFWAPALRRANLEPTPPENIYAEMPAVLSCGPEPRLMSKWIHQAFLVKTDNIDTHPCLRERVEALGQLPGSGPPESLPPLTGPCAAEHFLGSHLATHSATLGKEWADYVSGRWEHRHAESKALAGELQEAGGAGVLGPAPVDVLWKKAETVLNLEGLGPAQELIDEILTRELTHAGALFARGAWRLSQDDGAGVRDVERATELDGDFTTEALGHLAAYHHRHGQTEALNALRMRYEVQEEKDGEFRAERASVDLNDPLRPHDLSPAVLGRLQDVLATEPAVQRAWCAQKLMRHQTKRQMHVLCLEVKAPLWKHRLPGFNRALVSRLVPKVPFSHHYMVFVRIGDAIHLGDKMERMAGSLVYGKSSGSSPDPRPH